MKYEPDSIPKPTFLHETPAMNFLLGHCCTLRLPVATQLRLLSSIIILQFNKNYQVFDYK